MLKKILISTLLLGSTSAYSAIHWTADVKYITVYPNERAQIILSSPSSPNPAGSTFNCTSNVVTIGNPVSPSMLSVALTLYTTNRKVRIGIDSENGNCTATYLTAF